jgi:ribosome biogenesis GTPase
MNSVATVIAVFRGGCEVVHEGQVKALRLVGRHAHREQSLAVGDQLSFDSERDVVIDVMPRRTQLARRRSRAPHKEQVIAANIDRLAIVAAVVDPVFHSEAVDRFALAAYAGGLEVILVVNKIDLLQGRAFPEEIIAYEEVLDVYQTSAKFGTGVPALAERLRDSITVFAGHSGVGKSSLLNALEPELRLETAHVSEKTRRGRHTTTSAVWIQLPGGAVVVDTPGVSEIAGGFFAVALLDDVYPDIASAAQDCRFRDCRHDAEPDCAVRAAIETGRVRSSRLDSYHRLIAELDLG